MKRVLILIMILVLMVLGGCFGSDKKSESNIPDEIMTRFEVKEKNDIIKEIDYTYDISNIRNKVVSNQMTYNEGVANGYKKISENYNSNHNITTLTEVITDLAGTVKSTNIYDFVYDYSLGTIKISKNGFIKYEVEFFSKDDMKRMLEDRYKILFNYLSNVESGYALELNYLVLPVEESWNVKTMIKSAMFYEDNSSNLNFRIEYSEKNKILKEATKTSTISYTYKSNNEIVKTESNTFSVVLSVKNYLFSTDKNGTKIKLDVDGTTKWQKLIYYSDTQKVLKEEFTTNDIYLKANFPSYKKDYNYVNNNLYSISVDYSNNTTGNEKGVYTLNSTYKIIQYNNNKFVENISYNSNDTIKKYSVSNSGDITSITVMKTLDN